MTAMPWGRWRGTPLTLVPLGYLVWALEEATLDPQLRADIMREVVRRMGADPSPQPVRALPDEATAAAAAELITAGYRALARRVHPDAGGNHEAMVAATQARDWLRAAVDRGVAA